MGMYTRLMRKYTMVRGTMATENQTVATAQAGMRGWHGGLDAVA